MGKGRTLTGKFLYFCSAGVIFFVLAGFTPPKMEIAPSLRQGVSPPRVPRQKEPAKPTLEDLLNAKKLFELEDYVAALEENQRILSRSDKNGLRDQALFNIGLIYAHVENPQRNLGKALQSFKAVIEEHPQSPLIVEAKALVGILQEEEKLSQVIKKFKRKDQEKSQMIEKVKRENQELSQEIEKVKRENQELKQVDIAVEEKKRERAK